MFSTDRISRSHYFCQLEPLMVFHSPEFLSVVLMIFFTLDEDANDDPLKRDSRPYQGKSPSSQSSYSRCYLSDLYLFPTIFSSCQTTSCLRHAIVSLLCFCSHTMSCASLLLLPWFSTSWVVNQSVIYPSFFLISRTCSVLCIPFPMTPVSHSSQIWPPRLRKHKWQDSFSFPAERHYSHQTFLTHFISVLFRCFPFLTCVRMQFGPPFDYCILPPYFPYVLCIS